MSARKPRKNPGAKAKKATILRLPAPNNSLTQRISPELRPEIVSDPRTAIDGLTKIFQSIPGLFKKWKYPDEPPHGVIWKVCVQIGLKDVKINRLTEEEYESQLDSLIFSYDTRVCSDNITVRHKYFTVKYKFPDLLLCEFVSLELG